MSASDLILMAAFIALALAGIRYTAFFKRLGCHWMWIVSVFLVKVAAGFTYGWLMTKLPDYTVQADTWRYHLAALQETAWLKSDFKAWISDLYTPRYGQDGGWLATENSMLNDLKEVVFVKLLALLNLLTRGGYYTNVVVFNFLCLFGTVGIAHIWQALFARARPQAILVLVACFPSVLFWNSGLHRDGLLLHALGMLAYYLFQATRMRHLHVLQWLGVLLHLALAFYLRGYALMLFAGALGISAFLFSSRFQRAIRVAAVVVAIILMVLPGYFSKSLHLPSILYHRQQAFALLQGDSQLATLVQEPTWLGCLVALPQALLRGLFTPPAGVPSLRIHDLPFMLENALVAVLLIGFIASHAAKQLSTAPRRALVTGCIFFLFIALVTAYTVPFATAIVRYKSLALPFFVPALFIVLWEKGVKFLRWAKHIIIK